ncbi:MAG TPA: methylated-DNA--[protein]-cysteine S-methyltransferase [Steroidobacteraceae bacterium]|nr:methylated-DNA--[protein]-cysteine S-methyltransferase [Steroidobacteraceae bacterium]HEU4532094.1 methylated-DNA--[protein]-cysteine S-methyltransferase [Steroidobacteraceae bacterium]
MSPHPTQFALFDTELGTCGIAWTPDGVCAVQLPEATREQTSARLRKRFSSARETMPTPEIAQAIEAIVALLRGEGTALDSIRVDLAGVPQFNRRVYDLARAIPPGRTSTYGEIAVQLGDRTAARLVGQALGQNPVPLIIPCHRVLAAGGKFGGFSANGGVLTKLRLLTIEKAPAADSLFPP